MTDRQLTKGIDDQASFSIRGMPPSEIADKIEALERFYQESLAQRRDSPFRNLIRFCIPYCKVLEDQRSLARSMVEALALECARLMNDSNQEKITGTFYQAYVRLVEDVANMRRFLYEYFGDDLSRAETQNKPILDVCKEIMLRQVPAGGAK